MNNLGVKEAECMNVNLKCLCSCSYVCVCAFLLQYTPDMLPVGLHSTVPAKP